MYSAHIQLLQHGWVFQEAHLQEGSIVSRGNTLLSMMRMLSLSGRATPNLKPWFQCQTFVSHPPQGFMLQGPLYVNVVLDIAL